MKRYSGIWPVAPTAFNDDGTVDLEGSARALECMIDQGSDGVCILANYSEQFLLSDEERQMLTKMSLEHVGGRIPVVVTISHFATDIVMSRARQAKELGADIVMMMPPYHGATLKGTAAQTYEQFSRVGEVGIPIMLQDAPLSGVDLPVPLLSRMAREIEMLKLFKIECAGAAAKLRGLLAEAGDHVEGPFDGEEGITSDCRPRCRSDRNNDIGDHSRSDQADPKLPFRRRPQRGACGLRPRSSRDQPRESPMPIPRCERGDEGRRRHTFGPQPSSDQAVARLGKIAAY